MRLTASFAGLIIVVALSSQVEGGCEPCETASDKNQSRRSIDLNDALKVSTYKVHDVIPMKYHLEIKPDIGNAKFTGQVNISVVWSNSGSTITLNGHQDLEIEHVQIQPIHVKSAPTTSTIDVAEWMFNPQKSEWVIETAQILEKYDSCMIYIKYSGNLTTNDTSGFFRREYITSTGQSQPFVATQSRPQNARRWFPCIDEPAYKAHFELRVARPKNMMARSNTPIIMSVEMPGDPEYVMDHFTQTPKISTYQLALMISDFESIAPTIPVDIMENRNLEIRVWGRKEYLDSLSHVPNKIVLIVNYLQKYFNKSIGLPKLDLVAMPMYTAAKASDSWGLMFFRESELSSTLVWNTAHELIYQWIGQRVTPYKWSDAQVHKALNSFLAAKTTLDIAPDEMEGKWPMTMLYSLYYEFGKTYPFSRVAGIRDEATSAKAELLFRMFNYTLGEKLFRQGIQRLVDFDKDQLNPDNITTQSGTFFAYDVFVHLDHVVNASNFSLPHGLTIYDIAIPWIARNRVPLVTVARNYDAGTINFTQTVYVREAPPQTNDKMFYQWDIPIVMVSQDNLNSMDHEPDTWMTKDGSPVMTIEDIADKDKFIIVNPEEIGMFPVKYDMENWKMLGAFLQGPQRETMPVLTRAKLLHDAWNLAYAGQLCFGIALDMMLFLKNERSHVVWEPVFTMIDHVGRRIEGSNVHTKFEAYVCSLLRPLYAELGESPEAGEPLWKTHMRGLVKNFLCRAGYEPCVTEAREQFKKWMTDEEPDKGNPVANEFICPVFRWGTQDEWEFGLQRVINFPRNTLERKQNERTYLLKTLAGCPKDKYKIERLLNVTILSHHANFTDSDIHLIYSMLTGGAVGRTTLFQFLKGNWQFVKFRFENKKHLWNGIVSSASSWFNNQEGYDKVLNLYESRKGSSESEDAVLEKALKTIEKETCWTQTNLPVINEWLDTHLTEEDLASIETTPTTQSMTNTSAAPFAG